MPSEASGNQDLPPPVLVYHASARSIVFRDQLRRAVSRRSSTDESIDGIGGPIITTLKTPYYSSERDASNSPKSIGSKTPAPHHVDSFGTLVNIQTESGMQSEMVAGYVAKTQPLDVLPLGPNDDFRPLLEQDIQGDQSDLSLAEKEVVDLLQQQRAVVKTIKNDDWTAFLQRFLYTQTKFDGVNQAHADIAPETEHQFNSFVTSTTLLPQGGKKMRCYGSTTSYTVGVVFALPEFKTSQEEDEAAERTLTWAWPAGYSAKTEFNRNSRGQLINGRQEALRSISVMRQYNDEYLMETEYMVGLRKVSGMSTIPYNEIFVRVGGFGRVVAGKDVVTGAKTIRSYEAGVGLPVALFVRAAHFGHLVALLRTRARLMHVWGENKVKHIPLLYITPEDGVKVLTETLQRELWKIASTNLNPFQNSTISYKTTIDKTEDASFQQKVEELLDLDDSIQEILTPEELARLAGGFGATDESVAKMLKKVLVDDQKLKLDGEVQVGDTSHKLQDVVNEGMAAAVRAGDYHTSRQLLILYSLVASSTTQDNDDGSDDDDGENMHPLLDSTTGDRSANGSRPEKVTTRSRSNSLGLVPDIPKKDLELVAKERGELLIHIPTPPPPPLDTDRLRSATNSDGLLAVLGAAQVLRSMRDGSAQKRAFESVAAVEEWVNHGQQSMAFRISSWYDQKAAQGDLQIASDHPSNFMAFVSNKAITNRTRFAEQLKDAVSNTDFNSVRFLMAIDEMLSQMHSPCLRLELLQYILGLDNRFSVAHVTRSVELAATCMGISRGCQ